MSTLIGQSLGRYHILEQLGEGGMATVYKAFDTHLETEVAVKVIRTEKFTPEAVARALKRFEREAKALARLTHPNIVKVTDYGEFETQPYLVMPFLKGGNLKERLARSGAMPYAEAVRLLVPLARALEYAHGQKVIHRDVKPSNILITESGDPMLTDFGVAKVVEEEATVDLTGTAMAVGTPEYMAPEQATSKSVDHRADIYSLGVVLYEMVTGRKPFVADTPLAVLIKQASEPLPRPKQFVPGLPDRVEQILLKALAKKPEDRYQTMGDFAVALERCLTEAMANQMWVKNAQAQEETPPIATRPPTAATPREVSEFQVNPSWRKSIFGKPRVLINPVIVFVSLVIVLVLAIQIVHDASNIFKGENTPALILFGIAILLALIGIAAGKPGIAIPFCIVAGIGGIFYWQSALGGGYNSWSYAWALIPGFIGVGIFLNETLSGRPKKGLTKAVEPIALSIVLLLAFGSVFIGIKTLGIYWPLLLIVLGALVMVLPLLNRPGGTGGQP